MPHYVDYICVVDDASKDATAEIAARLASLGNRFFAVVNNPVIPFVNSETLSKP
ncbi:MAG: hypothetical protein ACU84J_06035 [Gammaproteobacteria bacterium]